MGADEAFVKFGEFFLFHFFFPKRYNFFRMADNKDKSENGDVIYEKV